MEQGQLRAREADPETDKDRIVAVLERNLPRAVHEGRHEWLYLRNPAGRAMVWLLEDGEGTAVGTSAGHPRRMRVAGEEVVALNLSDFAIDQSLRTLGPALKLLRATLVPMDEGRFAFSYDHPSEAMAALYRRMGGHNPGRMQRWVRPLEVTPVLRRRWGDRWIARVIGSAGDAALRTRDALARPPKGIVCEPLEGAFDEEFDRLEASLADACPVRGVRDAAYLEWRHRLHPIWRNETLCARRHGELLGYVIFRRIEEGAIEIVELEALPEPRLRAALLHHVVASARERKVGVVSVQALAGSPAAELFGGLGFVEREQGTPTIPYTRKDSPLGPTLADAANWWMIEGDRDV